MRFNQTETMALMAVILRVLWTPLSVWYLHFDGAGRLTFAFLLFSFLLLMKDIRRKSLKKPLSIYVVLALYMIANGLMMNSAEAFPKDGNWIIITSISSPILSMLIIAYTANKNFDKTTKWIARGLFIYCCLCLINSGYDSRERLNDDINANEMALVAALDFGLLVLLYVRKTIKTRFIPLSVIPLVLIVESGSKMGVGIVLIILLFLLYLKSDFSNVKSAMKFNVFVALLVVGGWYIMNDTLVGERLQETTESYIKLDMTTGTILDYYGDRGFQYFHSWPVFINHPIFGIGFHKWKLYNPTELVAHSEWIVQYVECGLVAWTLFVWFWISLLKKLIKVKKKSVNMENSTAIILLAILLSIIYANTVLWSYDNIGVFSIFALTFVFIQNHEYPTCV